MRNWCIAVKSPLQSSIQSNLSAELWSGWMSFWGVVLLELFVPRCDEQRDGWSCDMFRSENNNTEMNAATLGHRLFTFAEYKQPNKGLTRITGSILITAVLMRCMCVCVCVRVCVCVCTELQTLSWHHLISSLQSETVRRVLMGVQMFNS